MSQTSLPGAAGMVDRLNDLTRAGDTIQGRLYAAAERVDRLDRSQTSASARARELAPALRELWAIADEMTAHASRFRSALNL